MTAVTMGITQISENRHALLVRAPTVAVGCCSG
jgi:hypothetical protein